MPLLLLLQLDVEAKKRPLDSSDPRRDEKARERGPILCAQNHVFEEARISDLEKRKTKNDSTLMTKLIYFTQKAMRFWATEFNL